ncbi:VOC family protein [Amycolatopsis thermoflava]|uniref:Glyoxalase/bleomycin resistance protein/dioxygenase superfamily protein n=1 Tax=Amycolatopsis thermoflava TaxID=84480 RepID=A0A3N2GPY0_9PSEU|nr:VOC family protein [Amycolatopsis thermoflava]ROS38573.1 glyoxalase/bleomycin resistance protein/dioxygenase superfamily protein [Amycolatopsis thermoflava]
MSGLFGPIRQNGYVVRDLRRAVRHWTEVIGVGPFFVIDDQPLNGFRFRGEPSEARIRVALAQSGGIQIELIEPLNDAQSAFGEFLRSGREGLQHIAFWTDEFDAAMREAAGRGLTVLQEGCSGSGAPDERFVYFTAEHHPGTMIELSETRGAKGRLFRAIAAAAEGWDGAEPVRDMRSLLDGAS